MSHDAHELCVFFSDATIAEKTAVLLEFCAKDPDGLLDIIRELNGGDWKGTVRVLLKATPGRKINAIKECRAITGWGLKESKDAVEKLMKDEGLV